MYRIAMVLFIGFAPLFILSLLFKKTAPLFQKWLFYGLATIFSSVLLGVMSEIATDLVTNVAGTLFVADKLLTFVGGAGVNGIMEASTQQLGLGLILSTLLITVPPMAGMWFHGVMGNFTPFTPLSTWGVRGGQAMVPPSVDGGRSMQQVESRVAEARQSLSGIATSSNQSGHPTNNLSTSVNFPMTGSSSSSSRTLSSTDVVRSESQMGYAAQPATGTVKHQGNTDNTKAQKGENA